MSVGMASCSNFRGDCGEQSLQGPGYPGVTAHGTIVGHLFQFYRTASLKNQSGDVPRNSIELASFSRLECAESALCQFLLGGMGSIFAAAKVAGSQLIFRQKQEWTMDPA